MADVDPIYLTPAAQGAALTELTAVIAQAVELRASVPGSLVLLCTKDHHLIHDTSYLHETLPDGTVRFTRRT